MIDLADTYAQLARPWASEQIAERYQQAERRGAELLSRAHDEQPDRPIAALASAIPPSATLSVAIHVLHALPDTGCGNLAQELIDTARRNAAKALHRCHRALELDGEAHGYTADEWLPVISQAAAPLLESASLNQEPPTIVREAQDAISWLARSVVALDQESPETATTLTDTLARLLTVWVFAGAARRPVAPGEV